MFSLAFKPRTEARTSMIVGQRGFIGCPPSKDVALPDLQNMAAYWTECSKQQSATTGEPLRRLGLHSIEGRMHYLVLERFVPIVMGDDALPALERELREHHATLASSKDAYVIADFDQEPSASGDRRVVAFRHFPTLCKLRGILSCWLQQDHPLVAEVIHWDPASTMRCPEQHDVHGFVAGVRIGTPSGGVSLPALSFDTAFDAAEVDFNPGDVYFLVSEVMEFLDEASDRVGLPSLVERQAAADAKEPVNHGPFAEAAEASGPSGIVGMQAPSSDEDDGERERARVSSAIKKGRKIVRKSSFMR